MMPPGTSAADWPVPPLATFNVPVKVTIPDVATFGRKPVVPALKVETPVPAGVTQVPSPRQKVFKLAFVPLFKLATGKFPVTSVAKLT